MKLYYNPASPYVRKVRVLALEIGLMDDIELASVSLTPIGPDAALCTDNPIGKIPTLIRGDGILDAAVGTRYETFLRPEALRWGDWVDAQLTKVRRSLDALEAEELGDTVDIGTISVGCALGYLDFRYPDEGWRDSRPKLAAWYESFAARPSMSETRPA